MDCQDHFKKIATFIEKTCSELIPLTDKPYNEIFIAARYSLLAGGKRLRPLLAILTAEMLGIPSEQSVASGCALEMIHTYSLIHDDLPCMDDDDFRRGKPSLHKAFPEGIAVLAGDYLLTYAFEVLVNAKHLNADQKLQLISVLAKSSGGDGMIAGQVMDIMATKVDLTRLQQTHLNKTGMLIAASMEFGAIIGKATTEQKNLLRQFGLDIGLAFQIIDDILDVTQSKEKHGREVASDLINGKTTYVSLMGLEESKKLAKSLTNKALESLKTLPFNTKMLEILTNSLVNRQI